jgi:hypothetical protein
LGVNFTFAYDATAWLKFLTLSLSVEVRRLVAELTDWRRNMENIYRISESDRWVRRQADGLMFAFRTGQITWSDYIEITGVAPVTASRDLTEMVKAGLLIPEGQTRTRI